MRAQRAQALVWFVVMIPLLIGAMGLGVDGMGILRAHERAQHAADAAARAGAEHVLVAHSRDDAGAPDVLDVAAAQDAAAAFIQQYYPDLSVIATSAPSHITVSVRQLVRPSVLQLFHVDSVTITAHADAIPLGGITTPVG